MISSFQNVPENQFQKDIFGYWENLMAGQWQKEIYPTSQPPPPHFRSLKIFFTSILYFVKLCEDFSSVSLSVFFTCKLNNSQSEDG